MEASQILQRNQVDNYDENIFPILEGNPRNEEKKKGNKKMNKKVDKKKNNKKEEEPVDSDDEEDEEPEKSDYYGLAISGFFAALLGYILYANTKIVNFYGNLIPGFFEENSEVSMRGRVVQFVLVALFQIIGLLWLL
jgi:hypothetical protein